MTAGRETLREADAVLSKQWHPTLNGSLLPDTVGASSHHAIWWQCAGCRSCGVQHVWRASVANRARLHTQCPFCSGRQPCTCNSLAVKKPELVSEWHPTENGSLLPQHLTVASGRQVWWQCKKHLPHVKWLASVNNRTGKHGSGCPKCGAARRTAGMASTLDEHSELANQLHPTKNSGLQPQDLGVSSRKNVWWLCPNSTCQHPHEWCTLIRNRVYNKAGCPFCTGKQVGPVQTRCGCDHNACHA